MHYHLAQMNIASALAPLDDPKMAGFMAQLDYINALADQAPGFVWRLQSESGNATDVAAYDDPSVVVNMSVWESIEALHSYTYQSDHMSVLRDRKQWFAKHSGFYSVLWWVPVGHLPTVEEGKQRLAKLQTEGPSVDAFTFARPFPAPQTSVLPPSLSGCGSF
ncbi:MAG: DUF3291 domain-containing protein [Acidobacteria bacterium]|nr:DUF3291 domain-containing protein [Acidobacteriota bacterium]MCB9399176.1 DUF3291 domain-containing protein [Acidobacteriota bacterium]